MMVAAQRRSRKWLGVGILMSAVIVVAVVAVVLSRSQGGVDGQDVVKITEDAKEVADSNKNDDEVGIADKTMENGKEKIVQYEGEDPNAGEALTGVVTYAGVNGDALMVRVNIDQYLSSGECKLVLMQNGASVYSGAAGIVSSAATATCEGFNVPVAGLPGGELEIVVYLAANGKTGEIRGEVAL